MVLSGLSLYAGAAVAVGLFEFLPPVVVAAVGSSSLRDWISLGLAAGLGVLSAVIPYSLDQVILRMAGQAYFAVLLALLPLTAAVLGAFALDQRLSGAEIGGIILVVAAVALRKPAKEEPVVGAIDDIAEPEGFPEPQD